MKELSRENRKRFPGAIRRDRGGQRGATLVELALLLPILVVMVLGIIDFGRLIHARLVITNVSREGGSIGSRTDQQGNQQLITALQHSAAPFTISGADGRIIHHQDQCRPERAQPAAFYRLAGDRRSAERAEQDHGKRGADAGGTRKSALWPTPIQYGPKRFRHRGSDDRRGLLSLPAHHAAARVHPEPRSAKSRRHCHREPGYFLGGIS